MEIRSNVVRVSVFTWALEVALTRSMWTDVKTHACESRVEIRERPIQIIESWLLRKDDVIMAVPVPPLRM